MSLRIQELAFERNQQSLFHALNYELEQGEMLQIQGENGCGKSTLLRMLAGYLEPHAGNISWQGQSILQQREQYQQQIRYIGHQNGTKPYLTVYENLNLSARLAAIWPTRRTIMTILQRVGLQALAETQALYLSAGQGRRLALARLLLNPGKIWLLDEPTTALDLAGQALLTELLTEHLLKKGLVIAATHHDLLAPTAMIKRKINHRTLRFVTYTATLTIGK